MKVKTKFKITRHPFDWKALIGWLVFIAILWLALK
nr:MAG TPA: hypothetical protein [Caudoviricetes sp.]DAP19852.1 MAG TPA: hypothetical protein [Caudoviricetes sp.]DAS98404.1 MAG TPA: hypothetical protein [Bacteriophage sp.]